MILFLVVLASWNKESTISTSSERSKKRCPAVTEDYAHAGDFIVMVKDNGVGVSADNLKAVFSDGWQFKANMLQVLWSVLKVVYL